MPALKTKIAIMLVFYMNAISVRCVLMNCIGIYLWRRSVMNKVAAATPPGSETSEPHGTGRGGNRLHYVPDGPN